jgi:phosphoglycolate phosphatase
MDIDGLLITTGGAGTRSWRWAFDELYGIPADIGEFTESGMTDPVLGRLTFTGVIGREPSTEELASVVSHYLMRLPEEGHSRPATTCSKASRNSFSVSAGTAFCSG